MELKKPMSARKLRQLQRNGHSVSNERMLAQADGTAMNRMSIPVRTSFFPHREAHNGHKEKEPKPRNHLPRAMAPPSGRPN